MGRTSGKKNCLERQLGLFAERDIRSEELASNLPLDTPAIRQAMADNAPAQTDAKSRLIAEYLSHFQLVTRGGLYIDGFAAPQSRKHPDAWTARRVLEINPPRLRTFWLCDNDPGGLQHLYELKEKHNRIPPVRRVFVLEGDFNKRVDDIISSGRIKRRTAVFALLDQRNTECHWTTVQKLAAYAGRTRIELLYFLGIGSLLRSLTQSKTPQRLAEIDKWWGGPGWRDLKGKPQVTITVEVARRFQTELGYSFANAWPIYLREDGRRKAFMLIHATDHPEAPKLMKRAFYAIYGDREGTPTDSQMPLLEIPESYRPPRSCPEDDPG